MPLVWFAYIEAKFLIFDSFTLKGSIDNVLDAELFDPSASLCQHFFGHGEHDSHESRKIEAWHAREEQNALLGDEALAELEAGFEFRESIQVNLHHDVHRAFWHDGREAGCLLQDVVDNCCVMLK